MLIPQATAVAWVIGVACSNITNNMNVWNSYFIKRLRTYSRQWQYNPRLLVAAQHARVFNKRTPLLSTLSITTMWQEKLRHCQEWGSPSASDPRAKNTGQRATKGTVLTSQSLSPWCDCRRLGSTLASWRWQDINVGKSLLLRCTQIKKKSAKIVVGQAGRGRCHTRGMFEASLRACSARSRPITECLRGHVCQHRDNHASLNTLKTRLHGFVEENHINKI